MTSENLPPGIANALVDPCTYADMPRLHEAYTWARANNPLGRAVTQHFAPFWAVTKHADVVHVSRNNDLFHNSDRAVVLTDRDMVEQIRNSTGGSEHLMNTLVDLDGPEHRKLRALTQSWFMPASIARRQASIRSIARARVDQMAAAGGRCDFVTEVAARYPLHVVMEILGVPQEDEPRMLLLTQELFGADDPEMSRAKQIGALSVEQRAAMFGAVIADFESYFERLVEERRAVPRDDIATVLANATFEGEPLTAQALGSYFIILATAGHDTTSSSSATAMWALCRHPELLERVRAEPECIPAFVEETIRWAAPVRHFMRTATADTELRGRRIAKGDWLMLCYGSANRDEDVFERPFEFDIDRGSNKHVAFGMGVHACLGQHLARLEMRVLLEELVPRLEWVEAAGPMPMVAASFVGGPKHLPIRFGMR